MPNPDEPSFEFDPLRQSRSASRLEMVCLQLSSLPRSHQLAFALCCCERLYPSYDAFVNANGGVDVLRPIINSMWGWLGKGAVPSVEIDDKKHICLNIDISENETLENFWEANDAIGAVFLTLEAFQGDTATNVSKVSECARNRVDQLLWDRYSSPYVNGIYPDDMGRIEAMIASDPMMISEEKKQLDLFRFLLECETLSRDNLESIKSFARD